MSYYGPSSPQMHDKTKKGMKPKPKAYERLPQYEYNCRHDEYISLSRSEHFNRHNKRLRKTMRSIPWRDEWELQEVGKSLLSVLQECEQSGDDQNPEELLSPQEAFTKISVWKSRLNALEGLPHAIESTGALAQVYWRDSQRRRRRKQRTIMMDNSVSVMELRLAYSSAIVRCINGFSDSLQQQRAMAASVANLCGQLGIPSWLVDTRHESSHNTLPNLEVLRLSTSTLLEFMKCEYWIPKCTDWNNENIIERTIPSELDPSMQKRISIDLLLDYNACASDWANSRDNTTYDKETKESKDAATSSMPTNKRKKTKPSAIQKTTVLSYDPLFGEVASLSSSDGDDDNNDDDDTDDEGDNIDIPAIGSICGTSIGTNANRFASLEPLKKNKNSKGKGKGNKRKQKTIQNTPKKRKGEKSPNDCAKLFVQSVSSPQEGYAIATQYLIWGGIGEAPIGLGVLIPGSEKTFPATPQGVSKCWQYYTPLIHVICRKWPGFTACLVIHLVDCVLSTENHVTFQRNDLDVGSSRKLYFLSAWVRLILSQRFVAALDPTFSMNNSTKNSNGQKKGNTNPLELPLAQLNHLESLGYPLNSLLDRCLQHNRDDNDNGKTISSSISNSMKTSRGIIHSLKKILGAKQTDNFGYSYEIDEIKNVTFHETQNIGTTSISDLGETDNTNMKSLDSMSLDEMEAMLSGNHEVVSTVSTDVGQPPDTALDNPIGMAEIASRSKRPAWIRCKQWDSCSIGTLPGYPM